MTRTVRDARPADRAAVEAMTASTWPDQSVGDYLPAVFESWATSDDPDERCLVAVVDGTVVGVCHARLLTDDEGWLEGIRVHPDHRGAGHGSALTTALLDWCRDRGATVARNLVFAWNEAGMGQSRALGFAPVTTCRVATPAPATVDGPVGVVDDVQAAWRFWTDSDARTHLGGLAADPGHSWALAELTRSRLESVAETGRVLAYVDGGVRGMVARTRTVEDAGDHAADGDIDTLAVYAVVAWADEDAARALFDAVRADAAAVGADATRVWLPETARALTDAAAAGAPLGDDALVVLRADLTGA